jgi:hypothetical protein
MVQNEIRKIFLNVYLILKELHIAEYTQKLI